MKLIKKPRDFTPRPLISCYILFLFLVVSEIMLKTCPATTHPSPTVSKRVPGLSIERIINTIPVAEQSPINTSKTICNILNEDLNINPGNVYVSYGEYSNWGWNGNNF